jgi:hypothetical protein
MALIDLLGDEGRQAYRKLQRLLGEVWGEIGTTGSIPPLEQRISLSITKVAKHGFVPCVHADRDDSAAFKSAQEILKVYPFVTKRLGGGEAQSAYPEPTKVPKHAISGKLVPGSAISHGRYPFGTLGCVVEAEFGKVTSRFVVTAAHVVALNDQAKVGDAIYCPGKRSVERIKRGDVFGELEDTVDLYPLNPKSRSGYGDDVSIDIDVALIRITDDRPRRKPVGTLVPHPRDPEGKTMRITSPVREDELGNVLTKEVYLFGAASGFSVGILTDIGITKKVLRLPDRLNYLYTDLLGIAGADGAFSRPGDSGAIVYTEEGSLVGFLIGADNQISFACIGDRALKEYKARIVADEQIT